MLPRVLEVEVMDTAEEARAYDAMDFTVVNHDFVEAVLALWPGCNPVIDVCTGTARIAIELCRQNDRVRVVAVDLAEQMLALARTNISAANYESRITLLKADAKQLPFSAEQFGAALCNGSVHHIPRPLTCLAEMHRICYRGGVIFVRDLLRPDDEAVLEQLVNTHCGNANAYQKELFAASLRASLTLDEVREAVSLLGYGSETVQQTSDRHWTWSAIRY